MRRSNFALRLQPSLLDELREAAEAEGVALNQLIMEGDKLPAERQKKPGDGFLAGYPFSSDMTARSPLAHRSYPFSHRTREMGQPGGF
jgi:hypothetical protein